MVLPAVIGIIILAIIIYVALRVLKNVILAAVLIAAVFIASFLILGSWPDLQQVPVIGPYLPNLPSSASEAIATIKNVFYSIDILSVSRDSDNNILITLANTGKLNLSNFKVLVDEKPVKIINMPTDPLKSGETTVLQIDWKDEFEEIVVKTDQVQLSYKLI